MFSKEWLNHGRKAEVKEGCPVHRRQMLTNHHPEVIQEARHESQQCLLPLRLGPLHTSSDWGQLQACSGQLPFSTPR